jgi:hypothetical protein
VSAEANDIIEYNGTNWSKSFDATASSSNYIQDVNGYSIGEANITQITQYVTNTFSNKMYVFSNNEWSELIQTSYKPGYWTLSL